MFLSVPVQTFERVTEPKHLRSFMHIYVVEKYNPFSKISLKNKHMFYINITLSFKRKIYAVKSAETVP